MTIDRPFSTCLLTLLVLMTVIGLRAQVIVNMPNVKERPTATATSLTQEPLIDGKVIGEAIWEKLTPVDQLIQTKPRAGFPASEKTEIRIGYTATTFYLAVVCYDSEPSKLVVSDARRDATLDNTDSFSFYTRHLPRWAKWFHVRHQSNRH